MHSIKIITLIHLVYYFVAGILILWCLLYLFNSFILRLAVPIGYNFMILTRIDDSAFYEVMGPVRFVNFMGEDFNKWVFPICLLLMCVATIFNIYSRILNCIGLKQYSFDNEYTTEKLDDGKYLIE